MKKKNQAPHDEIKAYLKVAQERLASALFVRPEWRKPETISKLNWVISRINEVYYPFSDKKRPKLAVWKQVLREKREEMIEEIEAAKETQEKENKIKASGVVKEPVRLIEPGFKGTPAAPSPTDTWTKERIERLWDKIKTTRSASKIGRELSRHSSFIKYALLKGSAKNQAFWLPKIEVALNALMKPVLITEVDTSEAEMSINEVRSRFDKNAINHKDFMGQEYPKSFSIDVIPSIEKPERNSCEEILELVGRIYRMIVDVEIRRTTDQKRQILGVVAQLIDSNLVLTRQS